MGLVAGVKVPDNLTQAAALTKGFTGSGVKTLAAGVNQTYSATNSSGLECVLVDSGAESVIINGTSSTLFPVKYPSADSPRCVQVGNASGCYRCDVRLIFASSIPTQQSWYFRDRRHHEYTQRLRRQSHRFPQAGPFVTA